MYNVGQDLIYVMNEKYGYFCFQYILHWYLVIIVLRQVLEYEIDKYAISNLHQETTLKHLLINKDSFVQYINPKPVIR